MIYVLLQESLFKVLMEIGNPAVSSRSFHFYIWCIEEAVGYSHFTMQRIFQSKCCLFVSEMHTAD